MQGLALLGPPVAEEAPSLWDALAANPILTLLLGVVLGHWSTYLLARSSYKREHRSRLLDAYADYLALSELFADVVERLFRLKDETHEIERDPNWHLSGDWENATQRVDDAFKDLRTAGYRLNFLERGRRRSNLLRDHIVQAQVWFLSIDTPAENRETERRRFQDLGIKLGGMVSSDLGSGLPPLAEESRQH